MARLRLAVLGIVGAWALLSAVPAEGHKLGCESTRLLAADFAQERYGYRDPEGRGYTTVDLDSCLGGPTTKDRKGKKGKKHRHSISWRVITDDWRFVENDICCGGEWVHSQRCIKHIRVYQWKGELKAGPDIFIDDPHCTPFI